MSDLIPTNPVVYPSNLPTPYLIEFIRQLQERITELEARVTALETP